MSRAKEKLDNSMLTLEISNEAYVFAYGLKSLR